MAHYEAARNKTREKIERCFWELYTDRSFRRRVRVSDVTQRAEIHRSTFYMYFDSVDEIFESIKARQLEKLEALCRRENATVEDLRSFLRDLEALFDENRAYLRPLLAEYHSSSFSLAFRHRLREKFRQDADVPSYPPGTKARALLDTLLGGMIEMLISTLDEPVVSVLDTFPIAYRMMEQGLKAVLKETECPDPPRGAGPEAGEEGAHA